MKKEKKLIVVDEAWEGSTAAPEQYELKKGRIVQITGIEGRWVRRSDVAKALAAGRPAKRDEAPTVRLRHKQKYYDYDVHVVQQRGFGVSIGCKLFKGANGKAIREWAAALPVKKSAKKAVKKAA